MYMHFLWCLHTFCLKTFIYASYHFLLLSFLSFQGTFEYRGDDEAARLMYDGGWKDKAAEGYGVMKWQNGDR